MIATQSVADKLFWKCISYLMGLKAKKPLGEVCSELDVEESLVYTLVSFLDSLHFYMEVREEGGVKVLVAPEEKPLINIEFSLLEWLQFQTHFPQLASSPGSLGLHEEFFKKLADIENKYKKFDFFTAESLLKNAHPSTKALTSINDIVENEIHIDDEIEDNILNQIEKAISEHKILEVKLQNYNTIEVFPHKLVHIDGKISLVSEDRSDKSIIHFYIEDLKELKFLSYEYRPNYSSLEVDDFISGLRAINDTEIRLILKIKDSQSLESTPEYQYLGNPSLIKNTDGEAIWAAYVEPNDGLKDWLVELGAEVEILDPVSFKMEFLEYCEDKIKKSA